MKDHGKGWLEGKAENAEFLKNFAHEDFIEEFLGHIEQVMKASGISRAELARMMGCKPSNITQLFHRTKNLTSSTMCDIAFHLKLKLRVVFEDLAPEKLLKPAWQCEPAAFAGLQLVDTSSDEGALRPPLRAHARFELAVETEWRNTARINVDLLV